MFLSPPPQLALEIFVMTDCPISRQYAPEIRAIEAKYHMPLTLIQEDPSTTATQAKAFAKEFKLEIPFRLDPKHVEAKKYDVELVPTAVLFVGGKAVYVGRIDDRYPALGQQKSSPTHRDLRDAIDASLAGRAVRHARTKVIGCLLPPIPESKS